MEKANAIYRTEGGICLCFDVVCPNPIDLKIQIKAVFIKACFIYVLQSRKIKFTTSSYVQQPVKSQ